MTTFHTYIGECCREWILAAGYQTGRCGICGQKPTYKREDTDCSCEHCKTSTQQGEEAS